MLDQVEPNDDFWEWKQIAKLAANKAEADDHELAEKFYALTDILSDSCDTSKPVAVPEVHERKYVRQALSSLTLFSEWAEEDDIQRYTDIPPNRLLPVLNLMLLAHLADVRFSGRRLSYRLTSLGMSMTDQPETTVENEFSPPLLCKQKLRETCYPLVVKIQGFSAV